MTTQDNSSHLPNTDKQFRSIIKDALQHIHDPQWLGEHSPLATPYLLGRRLHVSVEESVIDTVQCGLVLRELIKTAVEKIAEDDSNRRSVPWASVLELRYLSDKPLKPGDVQLALNTSESAEGRAHNDALDQLVVELFTLIKPALRLESPLPTADFVGREAELTAVIHHLQDHKSIFVHGPSGIGKSTFGAALAHRFAPDNIFWFTVRPGLNDHINSVTFALAYFLQQRGITGSWMQMMADEGQINQPTISLLQYDLQQLSERDPASRVLLCFDEVDLLRPAEVKAHTELVPFLDSLRSTTPLLLIGQKQLLDAEHAILLQGLPFDSLQHLLAQNKIELTHEQILTLHRQTQGNPRLVELYHARFRALQRAGDDLNIALTDLADDPSVELLLQRIWRHLNEDEMHLLELFAVFQNPMPDDPWATINPSPEQKQALATLLEWRLLHAAGQRSITMLPVLKETIVRLLDADEATSLHLQAAEICLRYRQFSAAGYHYQAGGVPALTMNLLHKHLATEVDQGQAFAIEQTLKHIASHQLQTTEEQEQLKFLKCQILQTLGEHDQALEEVQKTLWKIPFLKVQAARLEGDLFELRGEATKALDAYRTAGITIEEWIMESASIHRATGYLHANERDFAQAELEVWRIRHDSANLAGAIHLFKEDMREAECAYLDALEFAKQAQYLYGEANANMNLGSVYSWQKDIKKAEACLQAAIDFFEMTGRTNKFAEGIYNLAFARRLAGHFQAAIEPAEQALELFTRMGRELGCAYAMQILAEVHVELDNLEQAEHFALRVLDVENTSAQPDGLRVLGEIRLKQGHLDSAEKLIRQSQQIAEQNEVAFLVGYALRSLGLVLRVQEKEPDAQAAFTEAIQIFRRVNMIAEAEDTERISISGGSPN